MNASNFFRHTHFRRAALASAVVVGALGAASSFAADATSNSTATVLTPITIETAQHLTFGSFAASGTPGTVTVATNGDRSFTGGALNSTVNGASTAAHFTVTGEGESNYSISWSENNTLTSGENSMALTLISALTPSAATSGEVTSGTLSAGTQTIYLGGTLTVSASQAAGSYAGDVTATVEYN
ncbi:DUF4402 domain-containing protein [Marinobacter sp. X15-166B]|uniref:DUF4402 domain-containing protein n=1 Tax=Marinobacter sp. X15-166B TaxID=1897620 RepID=UPI00085C5991|nr:DUF4402 domain-containing protein [Marinobacter sp. X15-166B]OEY65267.1 hypothetical protein BG841_01520 [Marinobacter sp. X15-166B]